MRNNFNTHTHRQLKATLCDTRQNRQTNKQTNRQIIQTNLLLNHAAVGEESSVGMQVEGAATGRLGCGCLCLQSPPGRFCALQAAHETTVCESAQRTAQPSPSVWLFLFLFVVVVVVVSLLGFRKRKLVTFHFGTAFDNQNNKQTDFVVLLVLLVLCSLFL